jgi:hypothetical protein
VNLSSALCQPTPDHLFNAELQEAIFQAIARIRGDLVRLAPHSAAEMSSWIDRHSEPGTPEESFRGLKAHFLLIPWFLEIRLRGHIDREFQRELVYSSLNAYYFVRLLDNISDGHSAGDLLLLPMAALFHSNFQSAYSAWFKPHSPFWKYFNRLWIGMADATVRNSRTCTFSEQDFVAVSSQKIAAVEIPVAAVCFRYGNPGLLGPWIDFYNCFACSHEMLDDLCDWHSDLVSGRSSFLLSEVKRRKAPAESIAAYMVRAGLAAGYDKIIGWLEEAAGMARGLDSDLLEAFVQYRRNQVESFWRSLQPSLRQLGILAAVLEGNPHEAG